MECATEGCTNAVIKQKGAGRPRKYCEEHRERTVYLRAWRERNAEKVAAYNAERRNPKLTRICILCGESYTTGRIEQRYCTERCQRIAERRRNRKPGPWDDRRKNNYHRRRARKAEAATGEPVLLAEIRERDENRCAICGRPVYGEYPHPMSPSLDHIIPLAAGGAHDPSNVQLAHLRCNSQKGAKAA